MKNVVTVSGGTGGYTLLYGLKNVPDIALSAVVSMADSGGANGMLREELGVLPPSDVKKCLIALSDHTETVRELMNYRFSEGSLRGHNFGSIFLAALEKVTGDFVEGVKVASEILKVKGLVIPVTRDKADLAAALASGTTLLGEHIIDEAELQATGVEKIFYKNEVRLNEDARKAIIKADYIILGPADFYTSLLPNLIVPGFTEALAESGAKIILPVNLVNKRGHTVGWKASDYVKNTEKYLGRSIDVILLNSEKFTEEQEKNYQITASSGVAVEDDLDDPRAVRIPLLSSAMFVNPAGDTMKRSFIRHDSAKLAACIKKIIK